MAQFPFLRLCGYVVCNCDSDGVDSMATSIYSRRCRTVVNPDNITVAAISVDQEMAAAGAGLGHFHSHNYEVVKEGSGDSQLARYCVVAMVRYEMLFYIYARTHSRTHKHTLSHYAPQFTTLPNRDVSYFVGLSFTMKFCHFVTRKVITYKGIHCIHTLNNGQHLY